jgi:hypothetical protein
MMPDTFGKSLRAVVVDDGGRLIGMAGVIHTVPLQCFGEFGDELRSKPRVLLKLADALKVILNSYTTTVYVCADDEIEASGRFLEYVGFEKVEGEDLYRWPLHSHT